MLNHSAIAQGHPYPPIGAISGSHHTDPSVFQTLLEKLQTTEARAIPVAAVAATLDVAGDETHVEWSEEDVVLLHWRLLKEIGRLAVESQDVVHARDAGHGRLMVES